MATAARLAKARHRVSVLERADRLGGALGEVRLGEFSFDAGPSATVLPAVVRDLFRKSGRPLEREIDLVPLDVVREHRFADGTALALPGHTRAGQWSAFDALSDGLGQHWVDLVAGWGDEWELLRKEWFERSWDPVVSPREVARLIDSRETLHSRLRRGLPDERARLVAAHTVRAAGHDPRRTPAWAGLTSYLEQRFGTWTVPGGMAVFGQAMAERLATRKVEVHTGVEVLDVLVRDGVAVGVRTADGDVEADHVVCAVDPHRLPALARHVRRTRSTTVAAITHLALEGELDGLGVPEGTGEVVLHPRTRREPTVVLRAGRAPAGATALTVHVHGPARGEAVLDLLAGHGLDVASAVVDLHHVTPERAVQQWGGGPWGSVWDGPRTARRLLGASTAIAGLSAAGAHSTAGIGLPFAGLTAAQVAAEIGSA